MPGYDALVREAASCGSGSRVSNTSRGPRPLVTDLTTSCAKPCFEPLAAGVRAGRSLPERGQFPSRPGALRSSTVEGGPLMPIFMVERQFAEELDLTADDAGSGEPDQRRGGRALAVLLPVGGPAQDLLPLRGPLAGRDPAGGRPRGVPADVVVEMADACRLTGHARACSRPDLCVSSPRVAGRCRPARARSRSGRPGSGSRCRSS